MLQLRLRAILGLLTVILITAQAAGCHVTPSNSPTTDISLSPTEPLTPTALPSTTITFVPPRSSSSLPSFTIPDVPTVITTLPGGTTADPTSTPTANPTLTVVVPPAGAKTLVLNDLRGDLFNAEGQQVQAGSYLDVVRVEVYVGEADTFFSMTFVGAVPSKLEKPGTVLEWGFYIDASLTACETGNIIGNDIAPDYFLRLVMNPDWIVAEIYDLNTNGSIPVAYQVKENVINFSVPASELSLERFDFTVVAREWKISDSSEVVAMDIAPDQGHYNMPSGHFFIKLGLPELQLSTLHATFWYNEGNEERARWCADAFEASYADTMRILEPVEFSSRPIIFVYASRNDFVAGLQLYSGLSLEESLRYKDGGTLRSSSNYIMHIPPDFELQDVYRLQGMWAMDRRC